MLKHLIKRLPQIILFLIALILTIISAIYGISQTAFALILMQKDEIQITYQEPQAVSSVIINNTESDISENQIETTTESSEPETNSEDAVSSDDAVSSEDVISTKSDTHTEIVTEKDPDGSVLNKRDGVNYYFDQRETYYNLPMNGVINRARNVFHLQGDYWVRDDGCKMFGDYIILAANLNVHPRGSIVPTSLGTGIVLDTGSFAGEYPYGIDIAVNW